MTYWRMFFGQRPQHIQHHTTIVQPGNHFSYSWYMLVWYVCRRMEMLLLPEYHLEELPQLDQDLSCKHPPRWPLHDDHKTVRCFGHAESRTQGWDWHGMVHTPVVTVVRGRLLTSKCMEQQQNQYISFRSCLSFLIFLDAHNAHSLPQFTT